jgi:hypothetical protein
MLAEQYVIILNLIIMYITSGGYNRDKLINQINYSRNILISLLISFSFIGIQFSSYSYIGTIYLGINLGTHINLKN